MKPIIFNFTLLLLMLSACTKESNLYQQDAEQEKAQWHAQAEAMNAALDRVLKILTPISKLSEKDIQTLIESDNIIRDLTKLGTVDVLTLERYLLYFADSFQEAKNLGMKEEDFRFIFERSSRVQKVEVDEIFGVEKNTPCYDEYEADMIIAYATLAGCVFETNPLRCLWDFAWASSVANGKYHRCIQQYQ